MNLVLENRNYRITSRANALNHKENLCDYLGTLKTLLQDWQDLNYSKTDIKKVKVRIKNVVNAIEVIDDYLNKI